MAIEGEILWQADPKRVAKANLTAFLAWLSEKGKKFQGYDDLWQWSVDDQAGFWTSLAEYFGVIFDGSLDPVLTDDPMPTTRWFPNAKSNYAEHVLRNETAGDPDRTMLHHGSEIRDLSTMTWSEVGNAVRRLATKMRAMGILPGDRVVAYMPNLPETVIAMLATTAIGGVWSSAAPEFGAQTVIDRFSQIAPKLVFATNGYRYGGRDFDRTSDLSKIMEALPTARHLVMLDYLPSGEKKPEWSGKISTWDAMLSGPNVAPSEFRYTRVGSDHPLWVLFTSGTTGLPKAIVHGHLGVILEHYKSAAFHFEIRKGGGLFFYSTTGWMVWNTLMWGPLMDGRAILYDGHPSYPDAGLLWRLAADAKASVIGVSPTYIQLVRQQGIVPGRDFDLDALENIMLVGSPSTPEVFEWVHEAVKEDIWASSQSGGTEFCSGLLAGSVLLPTHAGEIQRPALGVRACALDENGKEIVNEVGELAILKPMPSMPLMLWGDKDFTRYKESYFDEWDGVWRHGDRVSFNERGGSIVLGRSDATLNRFGVRIGSAEIYRTLETFPEVLDSLIVCVEEEGGRYYMPLFIKLAEGASFTDKLETEINTRLRKDRSPRHVPDVIIAVQDIPLTLTGKKMEVPVRKLFLGLPLEKVASRESARNPAALDWFANFAAQRANR